MKLKNIHPNKANPRTIKDYKFHKLVNSIKEFPNMMQLRPIVVDTDGTILGGNMRYRAICELGYEEIPDTWVKRADELTDEEKQRFIIEDNVAFGEWDYDMLANEWDENNLAQWGLDTFVIEKENNTTETERLSELKFTGMYYEPKNIPSIKLCDCYDTTLYDKKINAIENSGITKEEKELLKVFAYRFIRINFEMVANYYAFNASEEEKKIIERLRLVLVDGAIDGFIEDDLINMRNIALSFEDDEEL